MNIYSLLSFFAFITYLYLGIYTLIHDRKSKVNRTFFFVCLSFAIWAFSYTFLYPSPDKEICWFWVRIGSIGWCNFASFVLHFSLLLTRNSLVKRWWVCPVLYLPGIVCLLRSLTGILLISDFKKLSFGWAFVISPSVLWVWVFYFYYSLYILLSIWLYKRWKDKTPSEREKNQAKIIIIGTTLSLIFGSLSDVILPSLKLYILPPIAIIFVLIWAFGMWYAIVKYKMMVLTPEVSIDKIAFMISELLILIDSSLNIIKLNPKAKEMLGYSESELKGRPCEAIILDKEIIKDYFAKIKEDLSYELDCELRLEAKNGEIIPVKAIGISIKNKDGDILGIIIVGEDLRKREELEKYKRRLEIFTSFLSGNLTVSIGNIKSLCETLLKYNNGKLNPFIKEGLEAMFQRCKEVNLLIEDFIEMENL